MEHPIITKIEKQRVARYETRGVNTVSVIENIGIDKEGNRWRFYQDYIHEPHYTPDGYCFSLTSMSSDYGFTRLG